MNILIVSATPFEIAPLLEHLEAHWVSRGPGKYQQGAKSIHILISGVGMVATTWHLGRYLTQEKPDLVINAGIAGAFDRDFKIGDVIQVTEDCFGDLGVEEADGSFNSLFDLGLIAIDQAPFEDGFLRIKAAAEANFLPAAKAITVNKVHGTDASVARILKKYPHAQVESMEGAACFYGCQLVDVPCLQVRGISNYVEARNREAWDISLAIKNLGAVLVELVQ
jgi:futalosine hydrolase